MNPINTPAIAAAINPCATYWNINGVPNINPAVGLNINTAINNARINTNRTLLVLNQNPKIMKKNMMPHKSDADMPVAKYPGNMFGAMLSIEK